MPASKSPPDRTDAPRVQVIWRNSEGQLHLDWPIGRIDEALASPDSTVWIDITDRFSQFSEVENLFQRSFHFHPLAIQDALEQTHNPKLDDWDDYLYLVLQIIDIDHDTHHFVISELDLFLGPNYLISYHNDPLPVLDQLRTLVERDQGKRLEKGPDHFLYYLFDRVVSDYMPIIESLDSAIDEMQERASPAPTLTPSSRSAGSNAPPRD